ncbi:MAG: cysteine peptidase family C39 domain-containing protein [Caldilineaceae bacterium]
MYTQFTTTSPTPRFFVPEVVQTSAMDCGPAALKCLLEGFGIRVSYGRLREACQTDVDGTSINTLEDVAQQLGLHAEQMLAPADHLILPSAQLLPALVVTVLPNGFNHFVVAWRAHGPLIQLMDPATGRRWRSHQRFLAEVYRHTVPFSADNWRAWAATEGFLSPLRQRLHALDIPQATATKLLDAVTADTGWRGFATLDATVRMVTSLVHAKGVERGKETTRLVNEFFDQAHQDTQQSQTVIPEPFWTVRALPGMLYNQSDEAGMLLMRGAVLLKISGVQPNHLQSPSAPTDSAPSAHPPSTPAVDQETTSAASSLPAPHSDILTAALAEATCRPEWELVQVLRQDGLITPALLSAAALLAALSVTVEAALLRGLMVLAADLHLGMWRLLLAGGLVAFVLLLLALEFPLAITALRLGRQLEARIRIAFLEKIPRLGDRYFHSRLISDMAQRAYGLHQLHALPDLALRFLRLCAQLIFTTAGIIWLYPSAARWRFLPWLSGCRCTDHPTATRGTGYARAHPYGRA